MKYDDLQQALIILAKQAPAPYSAVPIDFANIMPRVVDYAEGRIYRDMVMLANRTVDASLTTAAGSRTLNLSAAQAGILVPEQVALITPAGTTNPALGTRVAYEPASLDVVNALWPTETTTAAPGSTDLRLWALRDDHTMVLMPTPDQAYTAEITAMTRPAPLSAANETTYLSLTYGELLVAAAMIFVSGYQRDFGAQSDDPRMAQSWESQYQALLKGAIEEEQRRRALGIGYTPYRPAPLAQSQRA